MAIQRRFISLVLSLVLWGLPSLAQENPLTQIAESFVDQAVLAESVNVVSTPVDTAIPVDTVPDVIDSMPVEDAVVVSHEKETVIKIGQKTYRVPLMPTDHEMTANYFEMGEINQNAFSQRRIQWLKSIATALHYTKWVYGMGVVTKKALSFKKTDTSNRTTRQITEAMIERTLTAANDQLWMQAPVIARSNEFGLNLSLLLITGVSATKWNFGGIAEIGLSFGYNRESKTFVFQIFKSTQKFRAGIMANLALGLNVGLYQANMNNYGPHKAVEKGFVASPPIPFPPTYFEVTNQRMVLGVNPVVGAIPTPFDAVFTYTTEVNQKMILRVETYPMKQMILFAGNSIMAPFKYTYRKVSDVVEMVRESVRRPTVIMCARVLSE